MTKKISAQELRVPFEAVSPLTVGLEEEAMLLDPDTLDLLPRVGVVLERVRGDGRFKPELPAAQIEAVTPPSKDVPTAIGHLARCGDDLAHACDGVALLAVSGTHPFTQPEGTISDGKRYRSTLARHGMIARRQLVAALQVHIAVGGADRTIAVHDALRCFLPEIAALAANAPCHDGHDTGMASMRPLLCQQLPRQGIPPAIGTWKAFADELRWGRRSGFVPDNGVWWWELRPHLTHGTLEIRVADAQTTLAEAAGIAIVVQALVAWLSQLYDERRRLPNAPTWRIAENRWSALRFGLDGELADLQTGERQPTRARWRSLLEVLEPFIYAQGGGSLIDHASALVGENGAQRQRKIASNSDMRTVTAWLAGQYQRPVARGAGNV